jgi:shikimate dehydrogenase
LKLISFTFVSGEVKEKRDYTSLNAITFDNYQIVINCTYWTSPDVDASPAIPYDLFTDSHIAYDLIYNPERPNFLRQAKAKGYHRKNGYDMLVALKSWEIWNK